MKNLLVCMIVGVFAAGAHAEVGETRAAGGGSSRADNKIGSFVGIGNPFPSILGINAAYHITPRIRATAGYGEVEVTTSITISNAGVASEKVTAKTYGLGAEYMLMEGNFTPVVGLHGGYFDVKGKGTFSVQGFEKSTGLAYANAGIDWLTSGGFNLGTGINVALLGGSGASFYGNIGYFF